MNAARQAFALIDKDDSGSLSKTEIVRAVREDRPVIDFLRNCGEENLQFLLQPARLEKALAQLDTDNSGEVDIDEWEEAIYRGLAKRVEQLQAEQERRMRAAAAADEEFSAEFLTMARAVFDMIDKDQSGTLTKKEIVDAVANDKARTRRPTNTRSQRLRTHTHTEEQPNDRVTLRAVRRKSSSFWRPAASRTCSFWSGRRRSGGRCACST